MTYFPAPLETDSSVLLEQIFDDLQARWPDWEPNDGNLEVVLAAAIVNITAELRDVASDVPDEILRVLGGQLFNTPAIEASPATADTVWTVIDTAGYTVPAGAEIGLAVSGSETAVFRVAEDVEIPAGDTTGIVAVVAVEEGEEGNGLGGTAELLNPLFDWVASITVTGTTSGGVDAESDEDYLDRLVARLQLMSPRPIIASDFAVLARDVAGVARAAAIDGYNPADDTFDNERMVTVAVVDEDGEALASGVKSAVDAYLQAMREVNFVVNVIDPTYTIFDVDFSVTPLAGWDQAVVDANVIAAVENFLSLALWGGSAAGDNSAEWVNRPVVRYLELAQAVNGAPGVDYIDSLQFGEQGGALAVADVTMDGAAPLPRPGVIQAV